MKDYREKWERLKDKTMNLLASNSKYDVDLGIEIKKIIDSIEEESKKTDVGWCNDY